jgi:hypothetical protein
MAETRLNVTSSWQSMITGALDVNLQNLSIRNVRYTTHTTTPTASHVGLSLDPGEVHPVKVASGSNLYVRSLDAVSGDVVVAIDVPA